MLLLALALPGRAQTTVWAAAASGNWNAAASWSPALVPLAGTNVAITLAGTYTVTYNSPMPAASIGTLTLGSASSIPTLTITAPGFNVAGSCTLVDSSAEVVNVNSGGVMSNGTLNLASRNGIINVNSGGSLTNVTTQAANNNSVDGSTVLKINSGAVASLGDVTVGRHTESSGYGLVIAGGTVSANSIAVGVRNSYATMAVSGGNLTNAGSLQLGTGTATAGREVRYYQTGGTVACAGTVDMAVAANYTTWFGVLGTSALFSANGIRLFPNAVAGAVARVTNSGNLYLGSAGLNVLNSGSYTVALNDQGVLGALADWSGNAAMVLSGGAGTIKAGDPSGAPHNITLSNVISGPGSLAKTGNGALMLSGANTYAGSTTVSAGWLGLGNAGALPKGTALTLGASGTAATLDLAGYNVTVNGLATAAGATPAGQLITNSSAVTASTLTYSNSGASATFGGTLAGGSQPIALTLLGGNLNLTGINAYAGNLLISSGRLALSGAGSSFTGPAIVLSNNAAILDLTGMNTLALGAGQSLSGYGVVTGVVVAANAAITPGTKGGGGTLTVAGGLTYNGNVTNQFDLGLDPNGAGNDQMSVQGVANFSGVNTLVINPLTGALAAGAYRLISYGALGGGGAANFQIVGSPGSGLQASLNAGPAGLDLVVTHAGGAERVWQGDGGANVWDGTSFNWLDNGYPDYFSNGNFVVFDDSATNQVVNLAGTLQPASVTVDATKDYTFAGAGKISGLVLFTKTNTATLTILTTNNYTGITAIGQGTLQIGNGIRGGALGTNGIQNAGTLALNLPGSNTFANAVSGPGNLVQASSGTLVLTASNSYTGGTVINAGTLQLNPGGWFGPGPITDNSRLVFNSTGTASVGALITGGGSVTLAGAGTVALSGNNNYSGGTTINAGTLLVNNNNGSGLGGGPVIVNAGGTLGGTGVVGGPVTINNGGMFAPGNPVGILSISNQLTCGNGAIINFSLGTNSDGAVISGNLTLSGTLNISAGTGFNTGTYTLFTYGGTLNLGTLTIILPANSSATLDTSTPGQVNLTVNALQAGIPAFPGALGFGAGATGARFGGSVYHVTTLSDSGTGSLRDAVSKPNRTIVFDVGGYIVLGSAVSCANNLTIAGQTAPGDGIGIMGHELSFSAKSNEIVRHLRIRPGSLANSGDDGINVGDGTNMIFDHVSIEFAPYDNVDAVGSATGSHLITIQNSILADPTGQQFNAHTEALGNNFSWFYNVFSSAHNRSPLAKMNTLFINNIVYNYQAGYTVANTSGHFKHDIINNYFIAGPSTASASDNFFQMDSNQQIYSAGNVLDSDKSGSLGGSATAPGSVVVLGSAWSAITPAIPTYAPVTAYRYDLSLAGALPHDQVDQQVVGDVASLGKRGQMWTTQTATGLGNNGYGVINGGIAPTDTDQDGLPDDWELALGSNPAVADSQVAGNGGYSRLENYLNWLAAPHAIAAKNSFVDVDLRQYSGGFTNISYVFAVGVATNGTISRLADGHTARFTAAGNFSGLGSFNFSVLAGDGSAMTNTVGVLVTVSGLTRQLVWHGDGVSNVWDTVATNWFIAGSPVSFGPGDAVTLDDTGANQSALNLAGKLQPSSLTMAASQNFTLTGNGSLGGSMLLLLSGSGTLTLGTSNSYTGGTLIGDGTLLVSNRTGSATGSGGVEVADGATLGGVGALAGAVVVDAGATLAPGNPVGTLVCGSDLKLDPAAILQFTLGLTNSLATVAGTLNLGGTLNVTGGPGFGAGAYPLLQYAGGLNNAGLAMGTTPVGYTGVIDTTTPGVVKLLVTQLVPPQIGNIQLLGVNFVISGTGGMPSGNFYLLGAPDLTRPLNQWTVLATNQFDASGNFTLTTPVPVSGSQQFYLLELP